MEMDENSKKLDFKIQKALEKYSPFHNLLEGAQQELARRVVIMVERAGGRSLAAKAMGIGQTTLDNYRSGKTQPGALELIALCEASGMSMSEMFTMQRDLMVADRAIEPSLQENLTSRIDQGVLAELGEKLVELFQNHGRLLSKNSELRLVADGYNRIAERAIDKHDQQELRSLIPWVLRAFEKEIEAARENPLVDKRLA